MLSRMRYRRHVTRSVWEGSTATLGVVSPAAQPAPLMVHGDTVQVQDFVSDGHFARARIRNGDVLLQRDPLGAAPLYYGHADSGALCFASEVGAVLELTHDVHELPPGCCLDRGALQQYFHLAPRDPLRGTPAEIARSLRRRLDDATGHFPTDHAAGLWLTGGLDSGAIAALVRSHGRPLHTVSVGLCGAPQLYYARVIANAIRSEHHAIVFSTADVLDELPFVIYHLGTFDPPLIRAGILHWMADRALSDWTDHVLCGAGGDELFAGYDYLKSLPPSDLERELLALVGRLHHGALQRVDRCAAAHGLIVHLPYLEPAVLDYALRIPSSMKLRDGLGEWILRQALAGVLPERVLARPRGKSWDGPSFGYVLAEHAAEHITDDDFSHERLLPNGWGLRTKEELLYYHIFRDLFGRAADFDWVGRTPAPPRVPAQRAA
jgi:asparagine synthase (glutamine-hydrolysing)